MLCLPEGRRKIENSIQKLSGVGKQLGLNLTNTEMMTAVARGSGELRGSEIPYLNTRWTISVR